MLCQKFHKSMGLSSAVGKPHISYFPFLRSFKLLKELALDGYQKLSLHYVQKKVELNLSVHSFGLGYTKKYKFCTKVEVEKSSVDRFSPEQSE